MIDTVAPGHVIFLPQGEWEEHLRISKDLILCGTGPETSVLRGKERDRPVVTLENPSEIEIHVTLIGIGLTGGQGEGPGIKIAGKIEVLILDCEVFANDLGIVVDTGKAELRGCRLFGNLLAGIGVGAKAEVTLDGCEVRNNGGGLFIQGVTEVFHSSIVENEGYGLALVGEGKLTLMASLIRGNKDGVVLWGRTEATLKQCLVTENWYGIVLWEQAQARLERNMIAANLRYGLALRGGPQVVLEANAMQDNGTYGIALYERPCFLTEEKFSGQVVGRKNRGGGNGKGDFCPAELAFLFTEVGGCLDRR